jgi:hypothetical protein
MVEPTPSLAGRSGWIVVMAVLLSLTGAPRHNVVVGRKSEPQTPQAGALGPGALLAVPAGLAESNLEAIAAFRNAGCADTTTPAQGQRNLMAPVERY